MPTGLPRISVRQLSLYISELLLLSDGAETWVQEPQVLVAWHRFFFTGCGYFLFIVARIPWLIPKAESSVRLSAGIHIIEVCALATLLVLWADLAQRFYRYLLVKRKDVRFSSIVTFWAGWVALFAYLYRSLYFLMPSLLLYAHPAQPATKTFVQSNIIERFHSTFEFLVYSAGVPIAIATPELRTASFLFAALNVVETLGFVLLVAIVVATFAGHLAADRE